MDVRKRSLFGIVATLELCVSSESCRVGVAGSHCGPILRPSPSTFMWVGVQCKEIHIMQLHHS